MCTGLGMQVSVGLSMAVQGSVVPCMTVQGSVGL